MLPWLVGCSVFVCASDGLAESMRSDVDLVIKDALAMGPDDFAAFVDRARERAPRALIAAIGADETVMPHADVRTEPNLQRQRGRGADPGGRTMVAAAA